MAPREIGGLFASVFAPRFTPSHSRCNARFPFSVSFLATRSLRLQPRCAPARGCSFYHARRVPRFLLIKPQKKTAARVNRQRFRRFSAPFPVRAPWGEGKLRRNRFNCPLPPWAMANRIMLWDSGIITPWQDEVTVTATEKSLS